jgi:hypothetical protein
MKKQIIIIGILTILVCVEFCGCAGQQVIEPKTEKEKFIGTWKNTSAHLTMNLFSDGTCKSWDYAGTWDLHDGKFVVNITAVGVTTTYTYVYLFFDENTTLKLIPTTSTIGSGYVLKRQ